MSIVYTTARKDFVIGVNNWDTTEFKAMLVTTGYVPNPDHIYVSSASIYEIDGTNYTKGYGNSGRILISGKNIAIDDISNIVFMKSDPAVWASIDAGEVGAMLIVVESGGSDATSRLVEYCTSTNLPMLTNGGDLRLSWSISGLINLI